MPLKWNEHFEAGGFGGVDTSHEPSDLIIWAIGFDHIWILKAEASNGTRATLWLVDMELGAETRMMELTDSSDELSRVRDESRHSAEETRFGIEIGLGLGIDLNEIPLPSLHETLPDSFEVVQKFHGNPPLPLGGLAELPGVENNVSAGNINHARHSSGACGACSGPKVNGQVVVCDGCERGFHIGYAEVRVGH